MSAATEASLVDTELEELSDQRTSMEKSYTRRTETIVRFGNSSASGEDVIGL